MSEDTTPIANWLADHPKMMGALFTAVLLLAQAGNVLAGQGSATAGP